MPNLPELFMARFAGLDRAHGVYPPIDQVKEGGKRISSKSPYTSSKPVTIEHWEEHLSGTGNGLGLVPINDDSECCWGCIDIDEYDLNFNKLATKIRKKKLPLIMCRTKSGGAHLYLFLSDWCPAALVRSKLHEWAIAMGYSDVEIFPKQDELASKDDTGNWINMPYFNHASTERYAIERKKNLDAAEFLLLAESREIPPETLDGIQISKPKDMQGAPPCLEALYDSGESKFRNNALYNFAVYCYRKFGDEWEQKLEDINQHVMQPPQGSDEVTNILKSVKRKKDKYFYKCQDQPICDLCNKEVCLKRKYGVGGGKELNIALSNLRKLDMDPPIWIVDVNGKGITLVDTNHLMNQQQFARVCVENINIYPSGVKNDIWREIVNELLDNVDIIEAPPDAGLVGSFLSLFKRWITEMPPAQTKDEILLDHPWYEKGRIYFRAGEMRKYVLREIKIEQNRMWAILKEHMDAESTSMRIKTVPCHVWSVAEFDQQTEDFEPPEIPEM